MRRTKALLGYMAAALTILGAILIPFVLIDFFTRGVAFTGVRVDPAYTGGEASHSVDRGSYRIVINHPVRKRAPLQRLDFVGVQRVAVN